MEYVLPIYIDRHSGFMNTKNIDIIKPLNNKYQHLVTHIYTEESFDYVFQLEKNDNVKEIIYV